MEQFRATGDTGVVLVGGASGVGKSSLVKRVLDTVYTKYSLSHSTSSPSMAMTASGETSTNLASIPPIMLTGKHDRLQFYSYFKIYIYIYISYYFFFHVVLLIMY